MSKKDNCYIISIFNEDSTEVLGRLQLKGVSELQADYITKKILEFYKGNCWAMLHLFKDEETARMKIINKGDNNGKSKSKSN